MIRLRADDLFWRSSGDEVVALDAATSRYLAANSTAATLWERLEHGATEAELAEALCERYRVEPDVAGEAVTAFLEQLAARGLLERGAG